MGKVSSYPTYSAPQDGDYQYGVSTSGTLTSYKTTRAQYLTGKPIVGPTISGGNSYGQTQYNPTMSGVVTNAFVTFKEPYKFKAYRTAAGSFSVSFAIIVFDTKDYDTGTNFNTGTGKFTAPIAGFYHFDAYARTSQSSGAHRLIISLVKNGTTTLAYGSDIQISAGTGSAGGFFNGSHLSDTVQLAAGDTVEIQALADSAIAYDVATPVACNRFSGFLVSIL